MLEGNGEKSQQRTFAERGKTPNSRRRSTHRARPIRNRQKRGGRRNRRGVLKRKKRPPDQKEIGPTQAAKKTDQGKASPQNGRKAPGSKKTGAKRAKGRDKNGGLRPSNGDRPFIQGWKTNLRRRGAETGKIAVILSSREIKRNNGEGSPA